MDSVLKRRRWIIWRKLEGWKTIDIAVALRIDERTVYRWWSLYRKQGWEGLHVKSKAPHSHWETPQETVELIRPAVEESDLGERCSRLERHIKPNNGNIETRMR